MKLAGVTRVCWKTAAAAGRRGRSAGDDMLRWCWCWCWWLLPFLLLLLLRGGLINNHSTLLLNPKLWNVCAKKAPLPNCDLELATKEEEQEQEQQEPESRIAVWDDDPKKKPGVVAAMIAAATITAAAAAAADSSFFLGLI